MPDNSKHTLICFDCRYTVKAAVGGSGIRRCPTCRQPLADAGKHFNVPKRKDDKAWKASEAFHRSNESYGDYEKHRAERGFALAAKFSARRR